MKKTIRLTESDLIRLVKKVINEQPTQPQVPTRPGTGTQGSGLGNPISSKPTNQLPICKGGEKGILKIEGSFLFLLKFDGSKFCRISSQPQTTSVPRPATSQQVAQTINDTSI